MHPTGINALTRPWHCDICALCSFFHLLSSFIWGQLFLYRKAYSLYRSLSEINAYSESNIYVCWGKRGPPVVSAVGPTTGWWRNEWRWGGAECQSSALSYALNARQLNVWAIPMPSIFLESLVFSLIWLGSLLACVRWDLFPLWLSDCRAGTGSWVWAMP